MNDKFIPNSKAKIHVYVIKWKFTVDCPADRDSKASNTMAIFIFGWVLVSVYSANECET